MTFLTILCTVYVVIPNYICFGFVLFLLFWILGRQLVEKTKKRLWLPLKLYATFVFIFMYCLSISTSLQAWMSKSLNLYHDLGFDPSASLWGNVWQPLAVLIVMQLYSSERRQRRQNTIIGDIASERKLFGFIKRLLIWHSDKLLSIALFYASLTPMSAIGFLYLLGLVICSTLPKTSRIPSKLFLVFTGTIFMLEYLFQMWGEQAGQNYFGLLEFFGFRLFGHGFWALEFGLRGKVLVIVACTLQYNTFYWLSTIPPSEINKEKWEEPCHLFHFDKHFALENSKLVTEGMPQSENGLFFDGKENAGNSSCHFTSEEGSNHDSTAADASESRRHRFGSLWGSFKDSHKWNKRLVIALRKERLDMQKSALNTYIMFFMENAFHLFGLELSMVTLLLASFALLNVFSVFYIVLLATCIIMKREIIRKLWPVFVFSFASILVVEYFAMWKDLIPWIHHGSATNINCHDCWSISDQQFDYCRKCWLGNLPCLLRVDLHLIVLIMPSLNFFVLFCRYYCR